MELDTPTNSISLAGTIPQTIWMERNTTPATSGQGLTLSSGGALSGETDLSGGDLNLKSGISTGTGNSAIRLFTSNASTSGTTDNNPTEKMTILGNGNVGVGVSDPNNKLSVDGTISIGNGFTLDTTHNLQLGNYGDTSTDGGSYYVNDRDWLVTHPYSIYSLGGFRSDGQIYLDAGDLIVNSGKIGLGIDSPTAYLNLKAGTSAPGSAPLKLTAGVNLTNTEAGTIEYDGSHLYFTAIDAGSRYQLDQQTSASSPLTIVNTSNLFSLGLAGTASGVSSVTNSNFIGPSAGSNATASHDSNFIGQYSGVNATSAYNSNFLGNNAGGYATNAHDSNFLGVASGGNAPNANNSNFFGNNTGGGATNANDSNFFGSGAGDFATNSPYSNFLGQSAGFQATYASYSNFIGRHAGYQANGASGSNFIGAWAGRYAYRAAESNFFGDSTGHAATDASYSNFLGNQSGYVATYATQSNFLGSQSGFFATNASNSNFLGQESGYYAANASNSNFLGTGSGYNATNASLSNLFGYKTGKSFTNNNIGSNNIIIGTNISLPDATANAINLGGVLYATGTQSDISATDPYITSMSGGKVGIGVVNPTNILSINGLSPQTIWMERNTTPATSGQGLTLSSGGALSGETDLSGGDLNLKSGISTGTGNSAIRLFTSNASTSGTTDNNPTEKMTILGNGNVGVGVSDPSSTISLNGYSDRTIGMTRNQIPYPSQNGYSLTISAGGSIQGIPGSNGGKLNLESGISSGNGSSEIGFYTANPGSFGSGDNIPTEKMRILGDGSVGIGNISPEYNLQVGNDGISGVVARFANSTGTCDINPTTSSLSCSSDINLKKNIITLEDKEFALQTIPIDTSKTILDKLLELTPVKYNWNSELNTDSKHTGFIAQQMEQIFPDLVLTDSKNNLKSISYANITPYLVKGIQEMNLKVDNLKSFDMDNSLSMGSLIKNFLSDATNNLQIVFFGEVHTKKLCLDDLCITKDQLQKILDHSNAAQVVIPSLPPTTVVTTPVITTTDTNQIPNSSSTPVSTNTESVVPTPSPVTPIITPEVTKPTTDVVATPNTTI